MYKSVGASIRKNVEAKDAVFLAQKNKDHESEYIASFQKIQSDWGKLPQYFVPTNKIVNFIETIESFRNITGATTTISNLSADKLDASKPGTTGLLKAHIIAQGSWSTAMRTLELAETLPYKVYIKDVRFSTTGKESGEKWQISFDIEAGLIVPAASSSSQTI